ncbi:unsaturated chondroitin disaccharide hydrolase [Paenibacillus phyllosphaerae]|uniref:Unsaturated chondroitin disaccharide hydrolase n=1 Tax=Paenibacillus phyllosphaerae TaxID=274593 RepID=A0A7W5B4B6_9BACL|nr:glycoside hydrolase family 88 protein [Paenibacillus phyllosphaerae]MBB3114002.1 unsaturated chondroitin disaccharide hydrolase [Paenibacillus phyllosphaerae]
MWTNEAWEQTVAKVKKTSERIGANFPHASQGGTYVLEAPHWWTAGFWPGQLWLLHEGSGESKFRELAQSCEEKLDAVLDGYDRLDHDLGFMWILTSLMNYKLHGGEESRRRSLKAANYLMGRFNLKGSYIRAWNPWHEGEDNAGWAIIDCAMNVPLLYWASRETGDPRYAHVAEAHMGTVLNHFIRPDGSVRHIVRFDPHTGEVAEYIGGQGYAPESAWSRGTAWAIYGLALAHHHTGREDYLDAAKRVAHFFLSQLPEDTVPAWDFRAPEETQWLKDSSAGACAACGLLLIGEQVPEAEGKSYRQAGERILESLYRNYGSFGNDAEEGLILHGTSHYPERRNMDVPLIYGDYFFVEGLARLKGGATIPWA